MATIVKRGNKYQVQVRRKGFPAVSRSFHRHSDAEEWARHMEYQADRGELPTPIKVLSRFTVRQIIERYRDEVSVKKKSHSNEIYILNAILRQRFVEYTLAEISFSHFAQYRDTRLVDVKAGTINRELAIIKHAFDIAMREWDMPLRQNPLSKFKKLKVNNARTRRLLPEEYDAIQEAIKQSRNPHLMPVINFAIETGMRRGEILRLRWQDIDFKTRTLLIPVTKNGHSRTIPLSTTATAILATRQSPEQKPSAAVFPLTGNAIKMSWERLMVRAKIVNLHFHDLRHEAISRLFEKGLSVPEVALISGHRDYRMLFRYTHLKPESLVEKLG